MPNFISLDGKPSSITNSTEENHPISIVWKKNGSPADLRNNKHVQKKYALAPKSAIAAHRLSSPSAAERGLTLDIRRQHAPLITCHLPLPRSGLIWITDGSMRRSFSVFSFCRGLTLDNRRQHAPSETGILSTLHCGAVQLTSTR